MLSRIPKAVIHRLNSADQPAELAQVGCNARLARTLLRTARLRINPSWPQPLRCLLPYLCQRRGVSHLRLSLSDATPAIASTVERQRITAHSKLAIANAAFHVLANDLQRSWRRSAAMTGWASSSPTQPLGLHPQKFVLLRGYTKGVIDDATDF